MRLIIFAMHKIASVRVKRVAVTSVWTYDIVCTCTVYVCMSLSLFCLVEASLSGCGSCRVDKRLLLVLSSLKIEQQKVIWLSCQFAFYQLVKHNTVLLLVSGYTHIK